MADGMIRKGGRGRRERGEKGEGIREKGEGRREKGEGRRERKLCHLKELEERITQSHVRGEYLVTVTKKFGVHRNARKWKCHRSIPLPTENRKIRQKPFRNSSYLACAAKKPVLH
jgi:hypothetical protein